MGRGSHPAQNPPPLDVGDRFVWEWYQDHSTGLVKDFGLMPFLLQGLGLDESGMRLMILKLSRVHETMIEVARREVEKTRVN